MQSFKLRILSIPNYICQMKQILLFGAGKSATVLIDYLLSHAEKENWTLVVADANLQLAQDKIKDSTYGRAVSFDARDESSRQDYIKQSDIVISMLPPVLHLEVAKDCIQFSKHRSEEHTSE